jgi:heme/copper-type cytochrome/quinol oxidase subunit 2
MICPYCRSALTRNVVTCGICRTAHHHSCWSRHGRCSVFGCEGSAESKRKSKLFVGILIIGVILIPVFTFFLFTALRYGAASAEFGSAGGQLALRQSAVIPSLVISFLLLGGLVSFFVADFRR